MTAPVTYRPGEAPKCLHCGTYLRRTHTPEGWRHMFGDTPCAAGQTTATPAPGYDVTTWETP
jgi:hypothetical protein